MRCRGKAKTGSGLPDPYGPAASTAAMSSRRRGSGGKRGVDMQQGVVARASSTGPASAEFEKGPHIGKPLAPDRHPAAMAWPPPLMAIPAATAHAPPADVDAGRSSAPSRSPRSALATTRTPGARIDPSAARRQADDARRPALARRHNHRARSARPSDASASASASASTADLDRCRARFEPVELGGDRARLQLVARDKQARAERGVADPPARIDPRPDQEAEVIRASAARSRRRRRTAPPAPAARAAASPPARARRKRG